MDRWYMTRRLTGRRKEQARSLAVRFVYSFQSVHRIGEYRVSIENETRTDGKQRFEPVYLNPVIK